MLLGVYKDLGVSGGIYPMNRPGFKRCVEKLREVGGGVIVAYAIDRIARINSEAFIRLMSELSSMNIRLYFVREEFVVHAILNNPFVGGILLNQIVSVSKLEREYISDRVRLAFQNPVVRQKFEKGFEKKTGLTLTKNLPDDVKRKVVEMRRNGATIREIAQALGISTFKVLKILTEAGLTKPKPGTCPRCFSKLEVDDYYGYVRVYHCKNCGYKYVEKIQL